MKFPSFKQQELYGTTKSWCKNWAEVSFFKQHKLHKTTKQQNHGTKLSWSFLPSSNMNYMEQQNYGAGIKLEFLSFQATWISWNNIIMVQKVEVSFLQATRNTKQHNHGEESWSFFPSSNAKLLDSNPIFNWWICGWRNWKVYLFSDSQLHYTVKTLSM